MRRAILRPDPALAIDFPLDDDPKTAHFGAALAGDLVGLATVCPQAPPGEVGAVAWQLRAIGVYKTARGQGVGKALVEACLAYVSSQEGRMLWASGRTGALAFYRAMGFRQRGEEYVTETGPHVLVWRDV